MCNNGNNFLRNISNFRKTSIATCASLGYLNDRPVFPDERRTAEAYYKSQGSLEAERAERKLIRDEEAQDREE